MASSSAAHKLRTSAHKILTEEECSFLKVTIRRFRETHSVLGLCISLKRIIDSPERIHLLPYINAMIPQHLQNDFHKLCQLQFKHYRPQGMKEPPLEIKVRESKRKSDSTRQMNQRLILPVEEFHNQRNKERIIRPSDDMDCLDHTLSRRKNNSGSSEPKHGLHKRSKTYHADTSGDSQKGTTQSSKRELIQKFLDSSLEMNTSELELLLGEDKLPKGKHIRRVVLQHRQGQSLGFSIRGGKDLKAGIFISEVDPGGQADRKGLKVGERILKVNDEVFKDITHAQAVVSLKSAQKLNLFVAPIGQMPGGTPNSTPRSICPSVGTSSHGSRYSSKESLPTKDPEPSQKMVVMADEDGWLGFSIRGGVDQGIEPCVAHVDPQSPAFRAGLTRGMKIEKVNETPVAGMNHLDMVQLVTVSRVVVLHVTEGVITPRRSVRKDTNTKPSEFGRGCNSDNPGVINDAEDECFFLKDLEFTPPMHSSTPLPPAGHPMLLNNGKNILKKFMRKSPQTLDSTIVQVIREDSKNLPSRSNRKMKKKKKESLPHENKSGGSTDSTAPMEADDFKASAKLDGGTIRLNLAGKLEVRSSNKVVDSTPQRDKSRMHVKDIFVQDDFVKPSGGTSDQPSANTNILSTPVLSPKHSQWVLGRQCLSPSSSDFKDAKSQAARQIRGELTGKNQPIPFTPNVPPSPALNRISPSPGVTLSKIFSKVTRRSQGEEFGNGSISDNSGGFHQQMDHEDAMKSSPYEMMSDSKLISNESEKVKVWSGVLY